ncbi:MAG: hypothetical protein M5R36_29625 [Deltaproteobacteria bacterium]|nr:hypothetical protein [Deltaproteobacteria bacterium]
MAMVYDLIDDDELRQDIRDIVIDLTDGLIDNYWWIVDVDGHPTTKGPNILPPMRLTWSLIAYHITGEERFGDIVRKWLRDEHRQELTTASITFFNHYADYYGNNLAHTNWYNLLRLGKVYFSPEDYAFFLDLFDTEVHTFTRLSHNPWFNGFFTSTDLYTPTKDDPFQDQLIEDLDTFQDPPMRFYFLPARTGWDPDPVSVILYNLMQQYPWLEVLAGGSWKIIADEPFPVDQQCSAGFMFQWNPYDVDDCGTDDPSNTHSGHDFLAAYWLGTYLGFVTKDM